ncbi:extracellular solute-binding protein [Litoreibacter sp.]|nr:extracellular solute-binding protein [Litoreibacter sp.]
MKHLKTALLGGVAIAAFASTAFADGHSCDIGEGRVSIIGNEFPAIQTLGAGAAECASDTVKVTSNLTKEHKTIQVPGMSGNPAEYTVAIISNGSIAPLISDNLIRPLDDLIAKFAPDLPQQQKITLDGKVMAIAFMANAQHMVYRSDVLAEAGLEAPKSYEDVLANAKVLRDKGIMQNPVGGAYSAGWGIGQEFNNMFMGFGGEFFKPGTAEANVNNAKGIATLNMMKDLSEYMNPDYLALNNNEISAEWKAGNVAMLQMWGSRTPALLDPEGSVEGVAENTALTGPMMAGDSGVPASTLWWDGFTVASNISDADAEASFKAMVKAIDPSILTDEVNSQAVWLIDGYKPTNLSEGVFQSINAGTTPYPTLPYIGLLHTAFGAEIPDFMQGKETAEQTLADVEAAYTAAAKEAGFLQ